MRKSQKKNEQGRSMVEMLGVLAIIGVLSVAGIAGYTNAMRSYRTNEIVNAASMLYIMAMSQNAGNGPTANVGYTDVGGTSNPSGVSTLQYNKDTKEISITFTDPTICIMAKNKLGDKASGECPSLSVSFGEATEINNLPKEDSECTQYYGMAVCTGKTSKFDSNAVQILMCDGVDGWWEIAACYGTCKDNAVHSSVEDTCNGGITYSAEF